MNGPIHDRYDLEVYKKYDSIFKLVNDDDISHGALENRPCHDSLSILHQLDCGHYAYSEYRPVSCGGNCKVAQKGKKMLYCVLCIRQMFDRNGRTSLRRWHDMLLPTFGCPQQEETWWLQRSDTIRQLEPAYLDPHGHILLPRIHCVIAMIRAYELREEDAVKKAIRRIIIPLAFVNKDAPVVAMEYLDLFLTFHASFAHVNIRLLATIAIGLCLRQRGEVYILSSLLEKLEAPTIPNFDEIFDLAAGNIWSCAGALMILDVKTPLPLYMHKAPEIELSLKMAKRIWTVYCGVEVNFGSRRWIERQRIMACCIEYSFKRYNYPMSYDEILSSLGEKSQFPDDDLTQKAIKNFTNQRGVDWTNDDIIGWLMEL